MAQSMINVIISLFKKIKETALSFLRHKGVLFEHLQVFRIGPIEKAVNEGYSLV